MPYAPARWPEVRQVAGRILRYARHPVLSALLPRGWRYRFTRWQARRVLAMARRTYREYQELMVGVPGLDGATAARLRPALRAFAVQDAAFERSPWWWGYAALRLLTALACVVLPAAVLADRFLAHGTAARVAAGVGYLLLCALVALVYGTGQDVTNWRQVAAVAGLCAVSLAVAEGTAPRAQLHAGIGLAGLAALVAVALVVIRYAAVLAARAHLIRPAARRRAGWPLPAQLVAIRLLVVLRGLHDARFSWWHPRWRRHLVTWLDGFCVFLEWELPAAAREAGLGPVVAGDAVLRVRHVTAALHAVQRRIADAATRDEYDAVRRELAGAVAAVVRGDWSGLVSPEQPPAAVRRVLVVLRRLVPVVVLGGAALLLPYLPGARGSALTGIQVGLAVAAALSLLPVDPAVRDRVAAAYTDASRTGP